MEILDYRAIGCKSLSEASTVALLPPVKPIGTLIYCWWANGEGSRGWTEWEIVALQLQKNGELGYYLKSTRSYRQSDNCIKKAYEEESVLPIQDLREFTSDLMDEFLHQEITEEWAEVHTTLPRLDMYGRSPVEFTR